MHFQTFITHRHNYKTNFTHFVFIGQEKRNIYVYDFNSIILSKLAFFFVQLVPQFDKKETLSFTIDCEYLEFVFLRY